MTDEQFRAEARDAVTRFSRTKPIDEAVWKKLEPRLFYTSADYGSEEGHAQCAERMAQLDRQLGTSPNRLFYISTPPQAFEPIITCLGQRQRQQPNTKGWQRIIIEKPFGRDLASARNLNDLLHKNFQEDQVFRID